MDCPYLTLKNLRTVLKGYKYNLIIFEHCIAGFSQSTERMLARRAGESWFDFHFLHSQYWFWFYLSGIHIAILSELLRDFR